MEKENRRMVKKLPDENFGSKTPASYGKRIRKGLAGVLGTAMIAAALLVLSLISPSVVQASAETATPSAIGVYDGTISAKEYYQTIEKYNLEKQIDAISEFYGLYLANYKKSSEGVGAKTDVTVEISPKAAASIGLKGLKNFKASVISMQTDKKSQSVISLFTNDKQFTSLDVLTDTEKELVYILIPELSKAYLKISANSGYEDGAAVPFTAKELTELLNNNPLTQELLNQLLKKYTSIIVEEISDVTIANDNVTIAGVNANETRMTVKLDEKTLLSIAEKVLTAAKADKDLLDLSVKFKICKESEYVAGINEALIQIRDEKAKVSKPDAEDKSLIMRVWADKEGNITGRDFSYASDAENSILGYKTAKNGSDIGIEAWYTPDKEEALKLAGKVKKDNAGVNGDIKISYEDSYTLTSQTFNIKLEDFKYIFNNSGGYFNGQLTITGDGLSGMSIVVNCSGDSSRQTLKLDFIQEEVKVVTVTIDSELLDYKDFNLPSGSAKIYYMETQIGDYIVSADIVKYLEGINQRIDVEGINTVIEQMLSGYSY